MENNKQTLIENILIHYEELLSDDLVIFLMGREEFKKTLTFLLMKKNDVDLINFALSNIGYSDEDIEEMGLTQYINGNTKQS